MVRLAAAPSPAAAFVCVDSLLAALPSAVVQVPDEFAAIFAADQRVRSASPSPARVVIDVPIAVRFDRAADALRDAVSRVGIGTLGTVLLGPVLPGTTLPGTTLPGTTLPGTVLPGTVLPGPDETAAVRVDSARARARRATWGEELFETQARTDPTLIPLDADPGLAGYLGGWS
jgi:hypothetical protein